MAQSRDSEVCEAGLSPLGATLPRSERWQACELRFVLCLQSTSASLERDCILRLSSSYFAKETAGTAGQRVCPSSSKLEGRPQRPGDCAALPGSRKARSMAEDLRNVFTVLRPEDFRQHVPIGRGKCVARRCPPPLHAPRPKISLPAPLDAASLGMLSLHLRSLFEARRATAGPPAVGGDEARSAP